MSIMTREISNYDDIIDSRDVIARIEELESQITLRDDLEDVETLDEDERRELEDVKVSIEDNAAELATLRALAEEGANSGDWEYGATLIRESYFTTYAQELAEDIHGHAIRNAQWPFTNIDWDAAADDLKVDYSEIDYDGVTYYVR